MTNGKSGNGGWGDYGMRLQKIGGCLSCAALVLLLAGGCAEIKSGLNDAWDEAVYRIHNATAPSNSQTNSVPAEKQAASTQPAPQTESTQESTAGKIKSGLNDAWDETVNRIHNATAPASSGTGSAEGETARNAGVDSAQPTAGAASRGGNKPAGLGRTPAAPKDHYSFGESKSMEPTPETVAAAAKWWKAEWAEPVPEKLKANADRLYAKGEEVIATNAPMAVKCFKAAAKSGCVKAQERMALLHYPADAAGTPQVEGVPANIVLFRKWMELAAKQGSVTACEVLGAHWYAFGNADRSHEWWTKAQDRGSERAAQALTELEREFPALASPTAPAKVIDSKPQPEQAVSREAPSVQEAPVPPSEPPAPIASTPEPAPAAPGIEARAPAGNTRFGINQALEPSDEAVAEAEAWWNAEWAEPASGMEIAFADNDYAKGEKMFGTDAPSAVKYIRRAAKAGYVQAQERMATLCYPADDTGAPQVEGIPANIALYRKWMEQAAEKGSVTACEALGTHWYEFGNAARSQEWWAKAMERGSQQAAQALAELEQEFPELTPPDSGTEESADNPSADNVSSQEDSGVQEQVGAPSASLDEPPAPATPESKAMTPDEQSRFGINQALEPSDEAVAEAEAWWNAEWAEPASGMEIAFADNDYAKGEKMFGTDAPSAVKYIRRAAKAGYVQAQERMATLCYPADDAGAPQVEGIPANIALYRKWMELAAEKGSVTACEALGEHWYLFGDAEQAHEWWTKAKERGSERADQALAELEQ